MSERVRGRKFRPIDPQNRLHRLGNVNTTGTYGTVSTWNVRVSHAKRTAPDADPHMAAVIPVLTGRPGRKRAAKRKRVTPMFAGSAKVLFEKASIRQLYNLRADMLTASIVGELSERTLLPEHAVASLMELTDYLIRVQDPAATKAMHEADQSRYFSIRGMFDKGFFNNAKPIRDLWSRIERALFQIRPKAERMPVPHEFKPEPNRHHFS